ncbi:TRAP transporter small permease [Tissierella sp. MSJ-40]|uniref:TRAP transporter small permease n=1 Tax=Tissierella simiarum TaxID=2841534 RepID=A0ABS6E2I0_9FIRM|nr:TRAP transporter small permease [Tissierella simiarum]MBU5436791.1 TRAP transporter small permease [Tissierella simiarum]
MKKIFQVLNKVEDAVASSLLIITSLLVFVQVILRYKFNYSISWSEEVSRMMIAWFIFIGSSMAVKDNAHVNMDALFSIISGRAKILVGMIVDIINIIFCIIIIIAGINMLKNAMAIGSMATSVKVPLYIPYASVPVGVFLMLIRYIINFKNKFNDLIRFNDIKREVK